ncbi:type II toxin-antitoxin system VapB family antitoxin [Methylobacterium oxalidis]|uniref:type II toxin-antitoxin system VapB family antitoxin n=1 Tax=Methylobacterium oxalidis TaxID=944322 RepID=UPI003315547A
MSLTIESEEVDRLAEQLATAARVDKTEAVRMALVNELQRREASLPLRERVRPLLDRIAAVPDTGLEADKAFFDELSGER